MSNRKMPISEQGKIMLDIIKDALEIERPMAVKIALAKGLAGSAGPVLEVFPGGNKWTIPEGIIKDKEFILFRHLILSELKKPLTDEELAHHMALFIDKGIRILKSEYDNKSSLEDFRISIL